jgi:hypothetical protein
MEPSPSEWWAYAVQTILGLAVTSMIACVGLTVLGLWVRREWPWGV